MLMNVVSVYTTAITMLPVLTLKMDLRAHVILAILGMAPIVKVSKLSKDTQFFTFVLPNNLAMNIFFIFSFYTIIYRC